MNTVQENIDFIYNQLISHPKKQRVIDTLKKRADQKRGFISCSNFCQVLTGIKVDFKSPVF